MKILSDEEQFALDCLSFKIRISELLKIYPYSPRVVASVFIERIIAMAKKELNPEKAYEQVIKTLNDGWEKDKTERKCN